MDSPPPAPLPPPPPARGMGCFAKGCLTLIIVAVALFIVCLCGGWFVLTRFADKFTATQPAMVEVQQPTPAEAQAAQAKREALRAAIRNNQETTVEFTADDLNTLIANDPDFRRARTSSCRDCRFSRFTRSQCATRFTEMGAATGPLV